MSTTSGPSDWLQMSIQNLREAFADQYTVSEIEDALTRCNGNQHDAASFLSDGSSLKTPSERRESALGRQNIEALSRSKTKRERKQSDESSSGSSFFKMETDNEEEGSDKEFRNNVQQILCILPDASITDIAEALKMRPGWQDAVAYLLDKQNTGESLSSAIMIGDDERQERESTAGGSSFTTTNGPITPPSTAQANRFADEIVPPIPDTQKVLRLRPELIPVEPPSSSPPVSRSPGIKIEEQSDINGPHSLPISLLSPSASSPEELPVKQEVVTETEKVSKGTGKGPMVENTSGDEEEEFLKLSTEADMDIDDDDQWEGESKSIDMVQTAKPDKGKGKARMSEQDSDEENDDDWAQDRTENLRRVETSDIDKQFGIVVPDLQTTEEKAAKLFAIFPHADLDSIKIHLQIQEGSMDDTFDALEEEFGLEGSVQAIQYTKGLKGFPEPSSEATSGTGSSRKRQGHNLDEKTAKKSRFLADPTRRRSSDLEPANEWVQTMFGHNNDFQIQLDSGIHPCRFPRKSLEKYSGYFRHFFAATSPSTEILIGVAGISCEAFDLAIQWACCKQISLQESQRDSISHEITAILNMILAAEALEIDLGLEESSHHSVMSKLKGLLIASRESFEDGLLSTHIRTVWLQIKSKNAIRLLFANALVRSWLDFRYPNEHIEADLEEDDEEDDEADSWRIGDTGVRWQFHKEMKQIPEFRIAVLDSVTKAWWGREVMTTKTKKKSNTITKLTDPLTGDRFDTPE